MRKDTLWENELYDLHALHEQAHWWFRARREIVTAVSERILAQTNDPLVVDVGCGTGANIAALSAKYRAVGIEPSSHAVGLARTLYPGVTFIEGHAPEDLGDVAEQADLFLLMDVLEHVPDDFALLSRVLSAAKVGSHLLITVPADQSLWSEHDVTLGHFRRYNVHRLSAIWTGLPVSVRLFSHFNTRLYPLIKLARRLGRWRGHSLGEIGTDQKPPPAAVNRVLHHAFTSEARRIVAAIDQSTPAYARGVSLLAVLRRSAGTIVPRSRPTNSEPDHSGSVELSKPI